MALLDDVLPVYDVHEVHDIHVDAPPDRAWEAMLGVTGREIRLVWPLMALRMLPAVLLGRKRPREWGGRRGTPILTSFERAGFARLAEEPGTEVVLGAIGRFWRLASEVRPLGGLDAFRACREPGLAKAAFSLSVSPEGAGSRVRTETRVATTDRAAKVRFRLYWTAIRPGSGVIRHSWLRAIARRASEGRKSLVH